MNITQNFRRKNKRHKPVVVFKELYRDYLQQNSFNSLTQKFTSTLIRPNFQSNPSIRERSLSNSQITENRKTNSSQRLTKYLNSYGDPGMPILSYKNNESAATSPRGDTIDKTYVFKLLQRNQLQQLDREKRRYFRDEYSRSHPFFQKPTHFFKQKNFDDKQNHIFKILPSVFKEGDVLKNPWQKRTQLRNLKQKIINRKNLADSKFSKIRHNFLLKKNYLFETQNNSPRFAREKRIKNPFELTKDHIFPQTCN